MGRPDRWLAQIAQRLRRLRSVPSTVLADAVAERGACMTVLIDEQPPGWLFDPGTDREVAARLCAGCPVQAECLELELRLFGDQTVGVWGALGEDDRRALVPYWRDMHAEPPPSDAGESRGPSCGVDGGER
jgi:WhiB family transcriptional regulator, redox-sensing transcriptional regulator